MKRNTENHPKVHDLGERLCELWPELRTGPVRPAQVAVGLLETLWAWTRQYAIQGDVGRWPNQAIARGCGWTGDADAFIAALITSRFLEETLSPHRLVVHDVQQHADNTWKQNLTDAGLTWWDGTSPRKAQKTKTREVVATDNYQKLQENFKKPLRIWPQTETETETEPETEPETDGPRSKIPKRAAAPQASVRHKPSHEARPEPSVPSDDPDPPPWNGTPSRHAHVAAALQFAMATINNKSTWQEPDEEIVQRVMDEAGDVDAKAIEIVLLRTAKEQRPREVEKYGYWLSVVREAFGRGAA